MNWKAFVKEEKLDLVFSELHETSARTERQVSHASQSSKVPVGFIEKIEKERRMFAESPDDNEAAPIDRDVLLKAREV